MSNRITIKISVSKPAYKMKTKILKYKRIRNKQTKEQQSMFTKLVNLMNNK